MDIVFFLNLILFDITNNLDSYVFTDTVVLPYILLITNNHFYIESMDGLETVFDMY